MNTKILEYIIAIAEEQSVSRAAERFYLTHAALSRHLKNMESELGAPLFTRTPQGMRPTEAGLVFVSDARAILHLEQGLNQLLSDMRRQRQHVIRIMMDTPFHNRFVQRVIPAFRERYLDHTLEVLQCAAARAQEAVLRGEATLALFFSAMTRSASLVYLPVSSDALRLVFPPDHTGKTDMDGLKEALDGGKLLGLPPAETTLNAIARQRLAASGIYPEHALEGEFRSLLRYIANGDICSAFPDDYLSHVTDAALTPGDTLCPIHQIIAYAPDAALSPAAQELMQLIIRAFGG
ncbi:MAG: LysR family transcriptional regulator [Clostridia bacterium]|nr:LysR family transcriptional regulator [Clostridia bacterium]